MRESAADADKGTPRRLVPRDAVVDRDAVLSGIRKTVAGEVSFSEDLLVIEPSRSGEEPSR